MNEPPTIQSNQLYLLYRACYDAVREIAPDLAVGVADTGSQAAPHFWAGIGTDVSPWPGSRACAGE